MSHRARLRWPLVVCAALAAALAGRAPHAAAQPARPNVVVIVSDDGGYADWGFMQQFTGKSTQFKTPRLDQLAQESVLFTNAYVAAPLCAPSRAGLITGRNQQRFGFEHNIPPGDHPTNGLPLNEVTIAERFKQLGYTTGAFGKWHLGESVSRQPQNRGFDEFFGFLSGSREYFGQNISPFVLRNGVAVNWTTEPSFNGIPNDPTHGRMLTDAIGDEASKFIATNAAAANPFMMYIPFNNPHYPNTRTKASDTAQFAGSSLSSLRKVSASLTYSMDRNIGEILDRLDDPNGDGNTSDSIRDNTIIIFTNDNGGDKPLPAGETFDNGPLRDYKGFHWEGGIRVPFMISAPGVSPGIVNEMVSTLDIFPTVVAAAGGANTTNTDGVDLMPYLTGQQQGQIHESLSWRMGVDGFAIRKGEWKLAKGRSNAVIELYRLNPDGSGEDVDRSAENPEKFQELIRDFVAWETTMDKLRWTSNIPVNKHDEFVQRNDLATNFNWEWTAGWRNNQDPGAAPTKLQRYDAAPNTILIFETRDDANYQSLNNLERAISHSPVNGVPTPAGLKEYMLNELRLRGDFGASANRSATLHGNALMFVNSQAGRQARISFDANKSATANYTFNVNMDVVLYHDTLLTGNGTGSFNIGGVIRDFYSPRSIIKEGTSKVTFSGHNTYAGQTIVRGGELALASTGAIDGSSRIHVQNGGTLTLGDGLVNTPRLSIDAGGAFAFTGGQLQTDRVDGSLAKSGGVFNPGSAQGVTPIFGGFSQTGGTLQMFVEATPQGTKVDKLAVSGIASLGGTLDIGSLDSGGSVSLSTHAYDLITALSITGTFSSVVLPAAPNAYTAWSLAYEATKVTLNLSLLPGVMYSAVDGINQKDLVVLLYNFGISSGATFAQGDANGDGAINGADLLTWQRSLSIPSLPAGAVIPEPGSCVLALAALAALIGHQRRRRQLV